MYKSEFNNFIKETAETFDIDEDCLIEQVNIPISNIWDIDYEVRGIDQDAKIVLIVNGGK